MASCMPEDLDRFLGESQRSVDFLVKNLRCFKNLDLRMKMPNKAICRLYTVNKDCQSVQNSEDRVRGTVHIE